MLNSNNATDTTVDNRATIIQIEVVFAADSVTQLRENLVVPVGTTVKQAIAKLDWLSRYPQLHTCKVGIFSKKVTWDTPLKTGDRIELYRQLTIDPMRKRQLKMQRSK